MSDASRSQEYKPDVSSPEELSRLEIALHDPDGLLTEALRVDERRRRTRRLIYITLVLGGVVMGTAIVAVLAGWLTLAAQTTGDTSAGESPTPQPAAAQTPLDEDARIERAEVIAKEGWRLWGERDMRAAAAKFEEAAKLDPQNADVWNGLGWARFNGGKAKDAIPAFEKCVELEPSHPAGLNGLGQIYLAWGELDKAQKYLAKAAPKAPAAQFGLARVYLLTGKYEAAERWIRRAQRTQPGDEMLKAMLAASRRKQLPTELKQQLAPTGKPQSEPAAEASAEGWRQFNEGNFRSAERTFRRALSKDPENLAAMNGLAFILLNSGKAAEAKQYFEKCLKIEPDAAGPMNGLARCLKEEGKVDEAVALWEKMHKKYPGPNAAAVGLATTYLERKQYDKALPHFETLVKATPENEEFKNGLEEARKRAQQKDRSQD